MSKAAGANPPRAVESGICASVAHRVCRGFAHRTLVALPLSRLWGFRRIACRDAADSPVKVPISSPQPCL